MKYYVLEIWGDVEPVLHGPFGTGLERDQEAVRLITEDSQRRNGIYALDTEGAATVGGY
jgi:hypothetical protein